MSLEKTCSKGTPRFSTAWIGASRPEQSVPTLSRRSAACPGSSAPSAEGSGAPPSGGGVSSQPPACKVRREHLAACSRLSGPEGVSRARFALDRLTRAGPLAVFWRTTSSILRVHSSFSARSWWSFFLQPCLVDLALRSGVTLALYVLGERLVLIHEVSVAALLKHAGTQLAARLPCAKAWRRHGRR